MALVQTHGGRASKPDLNFAYLMTGVAVADIVVSGIFGCIFTPNLVTTSGTAVGYTHQNVPLAAYMGWVFDVIALAMVLPAAMKGIRAKVTDHAPWTMLGLGVAAIWLAIMFISIFGPVMVTGTAPWQTWVPLASMISVVAGLIVTGLLCKSVKSAYFEPVGPSGPEVNLPTTVPPPLGF
jgi:hypothetical protein